MQARHLWTCDRIFWHHRFVDIMRDENGVSHIDYSHFDEIVPLDSAPVAVMEKTPRLDALPALELQPAQGAEGVAVQLRCGSLGGSGFDYRR